ncbi:MAG: aldo/keto reductase [Bacteroidales bacterium]|nr:aldo/keto reductase [Bacteroidales bacterium]
METVKLHNLDTPASRIGLGTWAIGGWMWGGTDEQESIRTVRTAIDKGINLIDTAPVYGFGKSEEIVGEALKQYGKREHIILTTKTGLDWLKDKVYRNATWKRIRQEIENSLNRLQTDYIDVYMVHWPDPLVPFNETAEVMKNLMDEGKIRSVAVSNFDSKQMEVFSHTAPIHVAEPPYNMFERKIEKDTLPYCKNNDIKIFAYGALCRGLLSGKMTKDRKFYGDDLRKTDPKFRGKRYSIYLDAVHNLDKYAKENYGKDIIHLAVRWLLDRGADVALWGARRPDQLDVVENVMDWKLEDSDLTAIDNLLSELISHPVGPEFMAPPTRDKI